MKIIVKDREPFELADTFYINPDDWFRKTWLIESNWSNACTHQFIVEADHEADAIDILIDSKFGHFFKVSNEEMEELKKEFAEQKLGQEMGFLEWCQDTKDIDMNGDGHWYHSDMFLSGCINKCKVEEYKYKGDDEECK